MVLLNFKIVNPSNNTKPYMCQSMKRDEKKNRLFYKQNGRMMLFGDMNDKYSKNLSNRNP